MDKTDECWVWKGARDVAGYGMVCIAYRNYPAHRVAWALETGQQDGKYVLHSCDNPPCVRRSHLFAGTNTDNMLDRDAKDRVAHGEQHYKAKLTNDQVRTIRRRYMAEGRGAGVALAAEYGVSKATISMIVRGQKWSRV